MAGVVTLRIYELNPSFTLTTFRNVLVIGMFLAIGYEVVNRRHTRKVAQDVLDTTIMMFRGRPNLEADYLALVDDNTFRQFEQEPHRLIRRAQERKRKVVLCVWPIEHRHERYAARILATVIKRMSAHKGVSAHTKVFFPDSLKNAADLIISVAKKERVVSMFRQVQPDGTETHYAYTYGGVLFPAQSP